MTRTDTPQKRLRVVSRHYASGQEDAARALLQDMPLPTSLADRAAFVRLHRDLGLPQPDAEADLTADLAHSAEDADALYDRAQALFLLDHPDALDAAKQAALHDPTKQGPLLLVMKIHLDADQPDAAADAVMDAAHMREAPGGLLLAAAKILGQASHTAQATRLLDAAQPHHKDNLDEFNFVAAGIKGTRPLGASQADMAAAIFDKFADDYDEVLADIDYSAPDLIGELLSALALTKMKRLAVLDAGCGTGLCAKLLRPYAKALHGADISVPMLQKAKARKIYNELTRMDLNLSATIPAGPFDLVVLADVLIYFGDLAPVLATLSRRLKPGGWVLLTVENGGDLDAPGFKLGASGRYKHSEDHIAAALSAAGLGRPKHMLHKTLRHEFGTPIDGIAVAAQKPILAF